FAFDVRSPTILPPSRSSTSRRCVEPGPTRVDCAGTRAISARRREGCATNKPTTKSKASTRIGGFTFPARGRNCSVGRVFEAHRLPSGLAGGSRRLDPPYSSGRTRSQGLVSSQLLLFVFALKLVVSLVLEAVFSEISLVLVFELITPEISLVPQGGV